MSDPCGSRHPDHPEVTCTERSKHADHVGFYEGAPIDWPNEDFEPPKAAALPKDARSRAMEGVMAVVGRRHPLPSGDPEARTPADEDGRIEQAFRLFHEDNPEVYETLVRLANEAMAAGHNRVSMKMLWEAMRWDHFVRLRKEDPTPYRLNNNYTSRYARLIMDQEPGMGDLFEVRKLRA